MVGTSNLPLLPLASTVFPVIPRAARESQRMTSTYGRYSGCVQSNIIFGSISHGNPGSPSPPVQNVCDSSPSVSASYVSLFLASWDVFKTHRTGDVWTEVEKIYRKTIG